MANKVSTRLSVMWRSFSVQALALIASQELWFPHVEALAVSYFGANAQIYVNMFLAVAGIMGWITPQKKIHAKIAAPEPWDESKR